MSLSIGCLSIILLFPWLLQGVNCYITYIEVKYPLKEKRWPPGTPWPLPQRWATREKVFAINPRLLQFNVDYINCDVIEEAVKRYKKLFSIGNDGIVDMENPMTECDMQITEKHCESPKFGDDESYEIKVPYKLRKVLLKSKTIWGMLRALETFSHLVYINTTNNIYLINETKIEDWPRFKHRGLMIDSSRHFIPMKTLLQNLDAMAYNKMNVFHWHIIDDQSFPFESKLFPNLTKLGAFSPRHVYAQKDVKQFIHEARLRGIRVIPEIDTPGHTQSFGKAFPNLLTPCFVNKKPYQEVYAEHAKAEILNPTQNFTYDILTAFFKEIRHIFNDDFIHLGMDEVYYDCWLSNPDIKAFMKTYNLTTIQKLEQLYVEKTLKNVKQIGFKSIIWQDPVDNGVQVSNDTIIQVWKDSKEKTWQEHMEHAVQQKRKIILSSCWYLNYISYGQDWEKYYTCDPQAFKGTDEEKNYVVGGEACLWSEYVDATNMMSRLWLSCSIYIIFLKFNLRPRASAVAERLWSDSEATSEAGNAMFRLDEHRCRMLRRGINAQPILNGFCGDYDWDLNNCCTINSLCLLTLLVALFIPFFLM